MSNYKELAVTIYEVMNYQIIFSIIHDFSWNATKFLWSDEAVQCHKIDDKNQATGFQGSKLLDYEVLEFNLQDLIVNISIN